MKKSRGKGWFGDSEAHKKAGRKGGLNRWKKQRELEVNDGLSGEDKIGIK